MAKSGGKTLSKSEMMTKIAEAASKENPKAPVNKRQVAAVLNAQAALAYSQAKNTFVIPGIGKLVLVERPSRKMIMRFGPNAGKEITVPKKKVLKFRVAKAAKDAILGAKK